MSKRVLVTLAVVVAAGLGLLAGCGGQAAGTASGESAAAASEVILDVYSPQGVTAERAREHLGEPNHITGSESESQRVTYAYDYPSYSYGNFDGFIGQVQMAFVKNEQGSFVLDEMLIEFAISGVF